MAKAILQSVATILLLLVAIDSRAAEDPHSLEKIPRSLAELRSRPPIVRYRLETKVFWAKGCKNSSVMADDPFMADERNRHYDQSVNLPSEDISFRYSREELLDVATGKFWGKGEQDHSRIDWGERDAPELVFWLEHYESAFNGTDVFQCKRVDKKNTLARPQGIHVPVGFVHFQILSDQGGDIGQEWLPIRFCEGGLAAPRQPFRFSEPIAPFLPDEWAFDSAMDSSGRTATIISKSQRPEDTYYKCSLRSDLHYAPVKWEIFQGRRRRVAIEITYEDSLDGWPRLAAWTYQGFNDDGSVRDSTSVRVVSFQRETSVDPSRFHLDPPDGLIVQDESANKHEFFVAGRKTLRDQTNFKLNDQLLNYEIRFQWFTRILAASSLLVGGLVVLIWRRFRRRQSAPRPLGQELPA
jgi:hypothetical protein